MAVHLFGHSFDTCLFSGHSARHCQERKGRPCLVDLTVGTEGVGNSETVRWTVVGAWGRRTEGRAAGQAAGRTVLSVGVRTQAAGTRKVCQQETLARRGPSAVRCAVAVWDKCQGAGVGTALCTQG